MGMVRRKKKRSIGRKIRATIVIFLLLSAVAYFYYNYSLKRTVHKEYGITMAHFNILRILRGQKGKPANLSTLQERMIDRSSNTTRLIDKLITKKWVTRRVCPSNRRKIEVYITELGLSTLSEIDRGVERTLKGILANLNEQEMGLLNTLLDKVRE